jgi:hypothetical protein
MAAGRFVLSDTNPNNQIGGGGCACSPLACDDQGGPYAVFPASETDNNMSPHLVVCAGCAELIVQQAVNGELLSLGEDDEPDDDPVIL